MCRAIKQQHIKLWLTCPTSHRALSLHPSLAVTQSETLVVYCDKANFTRSGALRLLLRQLIGRYRHLGFVGHGSVHLLRGTRRSRTAARSESSTSPNTHRPSIESSSSSIPLASSMMEHIDGDLVAMRMCVEAIDWLQSHALDGLPRRR